MTTIEELLEFARKENARLNEKYDVADERGVLAKTVKLSEEVGELSEQVLHRLAMQRKEKMDQEHDPHDHLAEEFADVLICTLLIADHLQVDVRPALRKKMEKIDKRYG